jgi:hypothetical protein
VQESTLKTKRKEKKRKEKKKKKKQKATKKNHQNEFKMNYTLELFEIISVIFFTANRYLKFSQLG